LSKLINILEDVKRKISLTPAEKYRKLYMQGWRPDPNKLDDYLQEIYDNFCILPEEYDGEEGAGLGDFMTLDHLLNAIYKFGKNVKILSLASEYFSHGQEANKSIVAFHLFKDITKDLKKINKYYYINYHKYYYENKPYNLAIRVTHEFETQKFSIYFIFSDPQVEILAFYKK